MTNFHVDFRCSYSQADEYLSLPGHDAMQILAGHAIPQVVSCWHLTIDA
jgi:hypothetical protein